MICLTSVRLIAFTAFTLLLTITDSSRAEEIHADICIYSGNPGGVMAAVQAAREGKTAVIIEPYKHLGGMTSGGLGNGDIGNAKSIGGLPREFYKKLAEMYHLETASQVEPHVAEQVFKDMVANPKIRVQYAESIVKVDKQKGRIKSVTTDAGNTYTAEMFIDSTYEGDLLDMAGVSFTLDREGNDKYKETRNGVFFDKGLMPTKDWGKPGKNGRRPDGHGTWDRDYPIDPYLVPGDPTSGLIPLIQPDIPGPVGSPAPGVQAYNYRMTMSTDKANSVPFTKPDNYDPKRYEAVARYTEGCVASGDDVNMFWYIQDYPLPNNKWDFNTGSWGSDLDGTGAAWCKADAKERAKIGEFHKEFQEGLYWFLLTDSRIPQRVKDDLNKFGYAKDEFTDNGNWPYQLYVREGRRMVSDYVMTEHNLMAKEMAPKSIGLGSYGVDIHCVRRLIKDGQAVREGKIGAGVPKPYPIDYASIVPKKNECENLFVTFALSASHIGFASIRMEPVLMNTGQSAASAACIAIDKTVAVQDVPYPELREQLLKNGQLLEWTAPAKEPEKKK